jgi:hypothetical protein
MATATKANARIMATRSRREPFNQPLAEGHTTGTVNPFAYVETRGAYGADPP